MVIYVYSSARRIRFVRVDAVRYAFYQGGFCGSHYLDIHLGRFYARRQSKRL